jgi:hypothetical protein
MSNLLRSFRPLRAALSTTPARLAGAGKVPTPTMDTPEKKPDSISNSNAPPSEKFAEEARQRGPSGAGQGTRGPGKPDAPSESGRGSVGGLGLGEGEPINPPDPAKGEKSASVGQQEFDKDGSDKRGDLGKTA